MKFPKATNARLTGEIGVNQVSTIVNNEFRWIFRRNSLDHDYGIDGYIDHVSDELEVTGLSIAIQIKTDERFFRTLIDGHYTFEGDAKHINYYMNSRAPVIIVVVDPKTHDARWVLFDPTATVRRGQNYKLYVPDTNRFDGSAKPHLRKILGDPEDYSKAISEHWALQDNLDDADYLLLTLGRDEIENLQFSNFLDFFSRITSNPKMAKKFIGRVNFMVAGYDDDPRELFEIPEFIRWMKELDRRWNYWFFFGATVGSFSILKLHLAVMCDGKLASGPKSPGERIDISLDKEKMRPFLERGFIGQNEMATKYSISDERNREISNSVMTTLFPDFPLK